LKTLVHLRDFSGNKKRIFRYLFFRDYYLGASLPHSVARAAGPGAPLVVRSGLLSAGMRRTVASVGRLRRRAGPSASPSRPAASPPRPENGQARIGKKKESSGKKTFSFRNKKNRPSQALRAFLKFCQSGIWYYFCINENDNRGRPVSTARFFDK